MENVPRLYINSVLCLVGRSVLNRIQISRFRNWAKLAADHALRRNNWTLRFFLKEDEISGIFMRQNTQEIYTTEYASFEDFAKEDPKYNQITDILMDNENDFTDDTDAFYDPDAPWTTIASAKNVESLKRLFVRRINYSDLASLCLDELDSVGVHSAIIGHLVDKNVAVKVLDLKYCSPASMEVLRSCVQGNRLTNVSLEGAWPLETTVPLLETLVRRGQLELLDCGLDDTCDALESLREDWSCRQWDRE
uniref:Mitochondrial ATP synthase regulatory component factor B n=1 Tax=Steinernema glaseri TaxID=37863 RepID=A0A1I7Z953_9BILA